MTTTEPGEPEPAWSDPEHPDELGTRPESDVDESTPWPDATTEPDVERSHGDATPATPPDTTPQGSPTTTPASPGPDVDPPSGEQQPDDDGEPA